MLHPSVLATPESVAPAWESFEKGAVGKLFCRKVAPRNHSYKRLQSDRPSSSIGIPLVVSPLGAFLPDLDFSRGPDTQHFALHLVQQGTRPGYFLVEFDGYGYAMFSEFPEHGGLLGVMYKNISNIVEDFN